MSHAFNEDMNNGGQFADGQNVQGATDGAVPYDGTNSYNMTNAQAPQITSDDSDDDLMTAFK